MPTLTDETPLALTRRARRINRELAELYPDAHCELDFTTPLELSVATILSAQCTDKRVNEVTPALFAQLPRPPPTTPAPTATSSRQLIKPTGFFRNKTTSLIKLGQALVERFDGEVPHTLDELVTLPGFGRKTANVVLGNAFGVPGLTVDTHFGRLVRRWGWTERDRPGQGRARRRRADPEEGLDDASPTASIWHGRRVCHARKPACGACPIARLCPSFGEGPTDPEVGRQAGQVRRRRCWPREREPTRAELPTWLQPLAERPRATLDGSDLSRFLPPDDGSGRAVGGADGLRRHRRAARPCC